MSRAPSTDEYVTRALESLKDFQRATVDVVYDNLFKNGQPRMLVADEVGLGKTIVARGVIARRLEHKRGVGDEATLKVTYICSNQVIAHENVGKLDVYPDRRSHDRFASRLTYLAFAPEGGQEGPLRLNTLTPATSFNKGSSTGQQDERRILYSLLMQDDRLRRRGKPVSAMLRASVRKRPRVWYEELENGRDKPCDRNLRPCCAGRFLKAIKRRRLKYSDGPLFDHLGVFKAISLYDAVVAFTQLLTLKNLERYRGGSDQLVRELKNALSEVCVDYIDADLYILDEFQRFKELVNDESTSETAEIARRIFGKQEARILLLSATPFKAYTGDSSWESGEEHYKEFRTILRFLFDDDEHALLSYEGHRQALFKQLLELGSSSDDIDTSHRDAVQDVLRRVMCRTERISVSKDFNAMTVDKWQEEPLQLSAGDIQNFVATDRIVQCLNETDEALSRQLRAPVEFCKSSPFPLSFLDDYKLKRQLRDRKGEPDVRRQLRANSAAWLNHEQVNRYAFELNGTNSSVAHAKLKQVLDEVLDKNGAAMLWVPPSLPGYPLEGAFASSAGFSKTLIFSAWLMVPRMLSSLISYEVERRTVGDDESTNAQERHQRKYFHTKNEKRHPIPQLVFSHKKTARGLTASNMSNFALLYPSETLAKLFDPHRALATGSSLQAIRIDVAARIDAMIEEAELERFCSSSGESDKWYWAAPLLLDRRTSYLRQNLGEWLSEVWDTGDSWFFDTRTGIRHQERESSSKVRHFDEFWRCFENPKDAGLGRLPKDLSRVLADMAIGSPSVSALRGVSRHFNDDFCNRASFALSVADQFLSMFNKPESISAVRLSVDRSVYWREVLRYCADGCLDSVLDELFHMLKADSSSITEMRARLLESMNLGTASIKVDDLDCFLKGNRRNMRCHYAVDLGNQRVETEEGKNRIKGIRQNFNSPFRPFVLATTSIGQEGLDFHTYCRKVVHWNLPANPIDLEQREGRINRFKGLVIRQQIASTYGSQLDEESLNRAGVWDTLFRLADEHERKGTGKCELVPFWHVDADQFQIERIIPFYPFSRDRAKLSTLLETLAVYRLAFGQPRQAELVEHLLTNVPEARITEIRDKLMIDLSPISYLS